MRVYFIMQQENDFNNEVWKDVIGFESFYEVSNLGCVRSKYRVVKRKSNSTQIRQTRLLTLNLRSDGYIRVFLSGNKRITKNVHRLVAIAFIPNLENKPTVNHIDGDKTNNNVSNLEWATNLENSRHAWKNGLITSSRGESAGNSKLKELDVINIRYLLKIGNLSQLLADKYGVSKSLINQIRRREIWKHI